MLESERRHEYRRNTLQHALRLKSDHHRMQALKNLLPLDSASMCGVKCAQ